ncbi:MAG TPA: hypothetical protein VFL57_10590, partial [Bryobacteraceae bacterium]|nr:hypothetical protein [Bryobacteraceae bacterium]
RWSKSDYLNYEAHHAPLAYALLAIPERGLARAALPVRVLILRIIAALTATLLLYSGVSRLFADLQLPSDYIAAAQFCILSCQMAWAATAHVANDWLALPLTVWSLSVLIRYWHAPTFGRAAGSAGIVSLGLLTKAYFLALLPVVIAPSLIRKRWSHAGVMLIVILLTAGPWYTRNLVRYGVITGMQEARSGVDPVAVLRAAPLLNWTSVAARTSRSALWTGNNSFVSFSKFTLNTTIAIWLFALIAWASARNHEAAEWIAVSHCLAFAAALSYITIVSFVYTGGAAGEPSPWYSQTLVTPLTGLAFLGCSRTRNIGRILAGAMVAIFGYLIAATYIVKLIPLYGGYCVRTSLLSVMRLYAEDVSGLLRNLDLVALAPGFVIISLAFIVAMLAGMQVVLIILRMCRSSV